MTSNAFDMRRQDSYILRYGAFRRFAGGQASRESTMWDLVIVTPIILLAAWYVARRTLRQATKKESCGSCGGCCPTPDEKGSGGVVCPPNQCQPPRGGIASKPE